MHKVAPSLEIKNLSIVAHLGLLKSQNHFNKARVRAIKREESILLTQASLRVAMEVLSNNPK